MKNAQRLNSICNHVNDQHKRLSQEIRNCFNIAFDMGTYLASAKSIINTGEEMDVSPFGIKVPISDEELNEKFTAWMMQILKDVADNE